MCERTISVTLLAALLLLPSCATKQTPNISDETPPEDLFISQNPDKATFHGDFLRYCSIVE